jgi:hypothetical protein
VARDAIARLYDVDADSLVLDHKASTITFRAKKGRLVDLDQIHESIWATRLSGGTGMHLRSLEVTAVGEVVLGKTEPVLKVPGVEQPFLLGVALDGKGENGKLPFHRLQDAVARGDKVVSVTGRIENWSGHFPALLRTLPPKPRRILVLDFQTAGPTAPAANRPAKP